MQDSQKPDHVTLISLIDRLREGRFVIPDFQREFEWKPQDIRELMRSIFLDYYIGSLLLWKGKSENFKALSCEKIFCFSGEKEHREHIVLDGQQRLSALYYAFLGPDRLLPNRAKPATYFVHVDKFMNEEYDSAFHYDWHSRRVEKILANREMQFKEHLFPLPVIGKKRSELANWLEGYKEYWQGVADSNQDAEDSESFQGTKTHADNAKEFSDYVWNVIEKYQVSYIELDRDLQIDKVCDIFTQINSRGVRLDVFDLMNALLKPKEVELKNMWRQAKPRLEFVDAEKMNVYVLQTMSILKQTYCSSKYLYYLLPGQVKQVRDRDESQREEILVPKGKDFKILWNRSVDAIESAIELLKHPKEFGVTSSKYLPYTSILPVFTSLWSYVKEECPPELQNKAGRKIRQWYWASVFTARYSGSTESTSAKDFRQVREWIADDSNTPEAIEDFNVQLNSTELGKEIKHGTSIYNGVFNLLIIEGARDWITGNILQCNDLDDHHIVPRSWGNDNLDGDDVDINTILNRTPLTADTNRNVIKDRLPNKYLPEMMKNDEEKISKMLKKHFISSKALDILLRDPFEPKDFKDFTEERQRSIQDAVLKIFGNI